MKRAIAILAMLVGLGGAPGCWPVPYPEDPSNPPAGDAGAFVVDPDAGTPAFQACAKLASLQCEEAELNCVDTVDHILQSRLTPYSVECVVASKTKAEARRCPTIKCP